MGRIDFSYSKSPMLIYAGSNLRFRFSGKHLSVVVSSFSFESDIRIGYIIDGREGVLLIEKEKLTEFDDNKDLCDISFNRRLASAEFEIPVSENNDIHDFILFKRMGGAHLMTFEGFFIDENGDITDQPPLPSRKIEFYGDSVCCGSVCEATDYIGVADPPDDDGRYNNSWHSFAMITARLLNAQINNISQGGMAVMNGTGYCFPPEYPGLERIYSSLQYMSYYPESRWNFSDYSPHLVVIAVGQNDPHREGLPDNDIHNPEFRSLWKSSYKKVLNDLMSKYPKAYFILTTTILNHDEEWDRAIDEIHNETCSGRVFRNYFRRNGCATHGHPRIPEQEEMAAELTQFIMSLGDRVWNS